ncbi:MAG TPA: PfkB family carbohydrate kinase [Bryobacteraceae bacterium]|nr:PfkB family carbohydrate kinase [Bryobacteraceae bacterium]
MTTAELLEKISALRVLIVGDICLDRWCWYNPALALESAETGIPRIGVVRTETTPGAGGTVANNVAAFGVKDVAVMGVVGVDGFGWELRQALAARGIDGSLLLEVPSLQTFTYTKLMNTENDEEDLPRVDFVVTQALSEDVEMQLVRRFLDHAERFDVIIISDQAETSAGGVVTPALRGAIESIAAANPEKVVWVDSRARAELFQGVIVKPNLKEATEASLRALGRVDFPALRAHCASPLLWVTFGGEGVRIYNPEGERWVKTEPVANPVDICGAGDSFSAGAACAYAVTRDAVAAAEFGNRVASITIMKKGTGTSSPSELLAKE